MINVSNPVMLLLLVSFTLAMLFLGKETKKSLLTAIPLIVFLIIIIAHIVQLMTITVETVELVPIISKCITVDFVLILLAFLSYIWVDEIETKVKNKKSIDSGLDWFWTKV